MSTLDLDDLKAIGEVVDLHIKPVRLRGDETYRAVFGNGQPGIKEDVATLRATQGKVSVASIVAAVGAVAAALVAFFRQS